VTVISGRKVAVAVKFAFVVSTIIIFFFVHHGR